MGHANPISLQRALAVIDIYLYDSKGKKHLLVAEELA
jgi:hypothetical protein